MKQCIFVPEKTCNLLRRAMRKWSFLRIKRSNMQAKKVKTMLIVKEDEHDINLCKLNIHLCMRISWHNTDGTIDEELPGLIATNCGKPLIIQENFDGIFHNPLPVACLMHNDIILRFKTVKKRYIVICGQNFTNKMWYFVIRNGLQHGFDWKVKFNSNDFIIQHGSIYKEKGLNKFNLSKYISNLQV